MTSYIILSIFTGLTLLVLNADYIVTSKRSKKQLNKPLHYIVYLIAILNIGLSIIYLILAREF